MRGFQFPILQRETQGVLRRKLTFFFAFTLYGLLSLVAVFFFNTLNRTVIDRGDMGRGLFMLVVLFGYPCLGLYSAFFSSSVLVGEREKRTLDLLLTTPVSGYSVILQKVLAPMVSAWLLVFGLMPILSLVFILGGVSPSEFLEQFISLAVWISTCSMIGLAVSVKAKSSAKAIGLTLGILGLLVAIPIFAFYYAMFPLFGPARGGVLLWAMAPVVWISPWGNGFLFRFDFGDSGILFLPNLYFSPPGAVNWILNVLLQLLLYFRLARNWNRAMEMKVKVPLVTRLKRYPLFRTLLMPLIRRERGPFETGHKALFEHQGRTLFTKTTRRILDLLAEGFLIVSTLFLFGFLASLHHDWVYLLFYMNTVVVGLFCLGTAMTSCARERDQNTSTLLLITPYPANRVFLEKWKYHLSFAGKMLIPAWGFPFSLWMLYTLGLYYGGDTWDLFLLAWRVLWFIPLVTLLAMYGGLVARQGIASVILGGILMTAGILILIAFFSWIEWIISLPERLNSANGTPLGDFFLAMAYLFVPILFALMLMFLLLPGFRSSKTMKRLNLVLASTLFGILAILGMGYLGLEFPLLRELRWMVVPLFFSGMLLRHLVQKPEFWWIDKLTRGGS